MAPTEFPYYLQDIMDWTRNSNAERKEIWPFYSMEFLFQLKNMRFFKKTIDFNKKIL